MATGMVQQPDLRSIAPDLTPEWMTAEHLTGTTIMAVEFADGVVVAADSRTTTGTFIANRVTDKLTPITDYIFCCRSGSAADTQAIAEIVKYNMDFHKMETGEEPKVKAAACIFKDMCYNYREQLMAAASCHRWFRLNLSVRPYRLYVQGGHDQARVHEVLSGRGNSGHGSGRVERRYRAPRRHNQGGRRAPLRAPQGPAQVLRGIDASILSVCMLEYPV